MAFTVTMPKLSPTMEEGMIAKWHKKVGDKVESGDLLVEVATDKATVEYNALDEGFLRKILVSEKQMAIINQPIAVFSVDPNENIEHYQPQGVAPKKASQPAVSPSADVQPMASTAPTAPAPSMQQPSFTPEPPVQNYEFEFPLENGSQRIASSPLARKLAKEKGVDLSTVKGSGPRGRVVSRDLDLAQPDRPVTFGRRELPDAAPGSYEEISLTPLRKIAAQRLQQSKSFIPHFYIRQEVDVEQLIAVREQLKANNLQITFNDFVIRAAAIALREHPEINSGFNSAAQTIISFKTIDISFAVSVEGGLITPIIRHADYKDLGEISSQAKELAARAKSGKLESQ